MDNYYQSYNLNRSAEAAPAQNSQLVIENLPLTATGTVALTLRGVVGTEASGGQQGIGGAAVTVYAPDGTAVAQAVTSATDPQTGAFTVNFNGAQNVYYRVTATAAGYAASTNSVTFSSTNTAVIVLLLPEGVTTRTFYGTVVDSTTGAGLAGVNVNITDGTNVNVNVTTGADGNFLAYDDFQVGTSYTFTASKLGYTGQTATAVMQDSAGTRVDFTLAGNADNYTSISGKVVIAGSDPVAPIASALVGLYVVRQGDVPADELVATIFTDYYGNYTFTDVNPANTYVVRAIKIIPATTETATGTSTGTAATA